MAADTSLSTRLERLPGVGTARAEKLAKLGLVTVRDALMHFPRDYQYVFFLRKSKRMAYRYERGQLLSMEFSIRKHDPHR